MQAKKVISFVGATGFLGSAIARKLLADSNVHLRCLVRDVNSEKAQALSKNGAELVQGDLSDSTILDQFTKNAYTVISTVQGNSDLIINGQSNLLQASVKNGVRRFIPSDFALNYFNMNDKECIPLDDRRAFAKIADKVAQDNSIEVVHILTGAFLDKAVFFGFLGAFDLDKNEAYVWGDGNQKLDLTTMDDIGAYTTAIALEDRPMPSVVSIAGEQISINEAINVYKHVTGHPLNVVNKGSFDDMQHLIDQRLQEDPNNMYGYGPLMFYQSMLNGRSAINANMAANFPAIKPTGVFDFVKKSFKAKPGFFNGQQHEEISGNAQTMSMQNHL